MVTEIVGVLTVIGIVFKVFKVVGCLGKGFHTVVLHRFGWLVCCVPYVSK